MHENTTDLGLKVTVTDRASMDTELDAAVEVARERATKERKGVLVTREGPSTFTVTVSNDVPHGLTHERQVW